jgi:hypothetical protein
VAASALPVSPPEPPLEHAANSSAETPATAATETNEDVFMALPFFKVRSTPPGTPVVLGGGTVIMRPNAALPNKRLITLP